MTISADVDGGVSGAGTSVGTGVITTTDGEILTNAHVVEEATAIRVRLAGESEPREATLLAADAGNDLALLGSRATTSPPPSSPTRVDRARRRGDGDRIRSTSTATRRSPRGSCRR
ncbi:MAG: trypsin-like peptidase domain-containing protein [Ilumatobacteraceae bacterium]